MQIITRLFVVLSGLVMLCSCATLSLNGANNDYKNSSHKTIKIDKNCFSVNVYKNKNITYYQISVDDSNYYIRSYDNNKFDQLVLVDTLPESSDKIGEATINVISKSDFDRLKLISSTTDYPNDIYVVTEKNVESLTTESDYSIYYMSKTGLMKRGRVFNNLSQSSTQRVISTIRNAGYVVTVPLDVAASPLYAGMILCLVIALH